MAHTFDTKTRSAFASTNPRTINHTCAGNATVLVLGITVGVATLRTGGAPTVNGTAMTQAGTTQQAAASPETSQELWYLISPITGVPLTISVPNAGALSIVLETYSFIASAGNITALDAVGGGNNTSTNPSNSITTLTSSILVVAIVGSGADTWAPSARTIGGSAGTQLNDTDNGTYGNGSQYILNAGVAGAKACAWTFGTSEDWAICSVAFKEVAAPVSFVKPTLVSYGASAYNTITTPKTVSVTYLTGDIIIVDALCETNIGFGTPTLTGVVFGTVKSNIAASTAASAVFAGIATSGGTANVSVTNASGLNWGYSVRVYRASVGIGLSSEQHTTTPTVALTPVQKDSAMVWCVGDFSAGAVQSGTPTPTNTRQNTQIAGRYTFYSFELDDQTSTGSTSYGLGGGAGTVSIIVAEVKGTASSGTLFPQSVGGTLTPAGVLIKQINKNLLAGTLTPSANVFKLTSKTMVGTITPAGALIKQTFKTMSGTITPTGALIEQIVFTKILTGGLSFSGQLVKITLKSLVGVLTPTGLVSKQTSKSITGTLTPTGTLLHNATFVRALTGTLNAIADLIELFIPGTPPATSDVNWVSTWIKSVWKRGGK